MSERCVMRATGLILLAAFCVAGCSGGGISGGLGGLTGLGGTGASEPAPPQPSPPPVAIAGRWQLSSTGRGQCAMTFGAASPSATDGTIAPEGGCPGKFFTSRKWTYDAFGLVIRDHTGASLARLSAAGGGFSGQAAAGEPVSLTR